MLLPLYVIVHILADVFAKVADGMPTMGMELADVMANIGESARTFAERFKEHQNSPSPIFDHCNISGHKVTIDNFTIVGREDQNLIRATKEALFISVNDPSLNRNIGKYYLPHIWDGSYTKHQN